MGSEANRIDVLDAVAAWNEAAAMDAFLEGDVKRMNRLLRNASHCRSEIDFLNWSARRQAALSKASA